MLRRLCYFHFHLQASLIACVVLPFCEGEAVCRRQGVFHQVKKGDLVTNITSQHYVSSWLDCGQHCLQEETCIAFKYRSSNKRNEPNCEIGGKLEDSTHVTEITDSEWAVYKILDIESPLCLKNPCKNGGKCVGSPACESEGYKCACEENYTGRFCEQIIYATSCKSIQTTSTKNASFKIKTETPDRFSNVYCQMTSLPGCSGGGWTMVMKIDGKKDTFRYNSPYWSNNSSYNVEGGLTSFDDQETKLPTYWSTPFDELCIGMKVGDDLNFISINRTANSLYSLFADGKYRDTDIGYEKWKSLINNSSLQRNCTVEGINIARGNVVENVRTRLGIIGNEQSHCESPDSFVGFGGENCTYSAYCNWRQSSPTICGNFAGCMPDNGDRDIKAMGYILVR